MESGTRFRQFMIGGVQRAACDAASGAGKPARDLRIDVIRGLALLFIFVNHMPGNVAASWTPANFGFSDAADIFVLLAGVSAALAFGPIIDRRGLGVAAARIGARIGTLYAAHLAVFLIVCGVVAVAVTRTQNPLYIEAINIQPLFNDPLATLIGALTLTYQPFYLDILPLYVALLALFPVLYLGARLSPLVTLGASAAIWQGSVAVGLNLPNGGAAGWYFNPFAWQFLFAIGVVAGLALQGRLALPRSRLIDIAALAVVLLSALIKLSPGNPFGVAMLSDVVERLQIGNDKTHLPPVRVVHMLALAWLTMRVIPASSRLLSGFAGRNLAAMGRHSLPVFCVGTVLSVAGQIVMAETYHHLGVQLLVCLIGVTVLIGLGNVLTWYQSLATSPAAPRPARGPVVASGALSGSAS